MGAPVAMTAAHTRHLRRPGLRARRTTWDAPSWHHPAYSGRAAKEVTRHARRPTSYATCAHARTHTHTYRAHRTFLQKTMCSAPRRHRCYTPLYTHAHTHTYTHTRLSIYLCLHIHICIYVSMYIHIHISICLSVYTVLSDGAAATPLHTHTHTHIHTSIHLSIYTHISIYRSIYRSIYSVLIGGVAAGHPRPWICCSLCLFCKWSCCRRRASLFLHYH